MNKPENNLSIFIDALTKQEAELRSKTNYCFEHNFKKDGEWLRMKLDIIREIRSEAELISGDNTLRPVFIFSDKP